MKRYGGLWQEFRALLATWLVSLASSVHFRATMDLARELTAVERGELEDDALLALRMAFADARPNGWDWDERARELWAEVRGEPS